MNFPLINRILFVLVNDRKVLFTKVFVVYGVVWAILEPILAFFPEAEPHFSGWKRYCLMLAVSFIIGLVWGLPLMQIKLYLKEFNSTIIIRFGDLFKQDGVSVIPVSQFMFEIGVVETSLQYAVINKFIENQRHDEKYTKYFKMLNEKLKDISHTEVERECNREYEKFRYPLGTTTLLNIQGKDFIYFALTKTELKEHLPIPPQKNCDLEKMELALKGMFQYARRETRSKPLNIPLIGSGISGIVPRNPLFLLERNFHAIYSSIVEGGAISEKEVRIILHPNYFSQINLRRFKENWS